jgi:hypothetical protein
MMARGIQFDDREALALTWRQKFQLRIEGQQVEAYMIWMKSACHPDFPADGEEEEIEEGQPQDAQARKPMASKGAGLMSTSIDRSSVQKKPLRNQNGRQIIKARGVLLFDAPPPAPTGNVCVVVFGHESPQSGYNNWGRVAQYMGLGGLVGGGATHIVEELLGRILNVGMPRM